MFNRLTTAQLNGTPELALKTYLKPSLRLLDERGSDRLGPVQMCSEAIAEDLHALRNLIRLSSSETVSGTTRGLIPRPRPDQRAASPPMAGRLSPVW